MTRRLRSVLVACFFLFSVQAAAQKNLTQQKLPQEPVAKVKDAAVSRTDSHRAASAQPVHGLQKAQAPAAPSPLGESLAHGSDDSASVALGAFVRMIVVLAGVLLLVYLLLHKGLGKLRNKLSHGRLIRVVDRVGLEPKKTLYVIEVAERYYLIGAGDQGLTHLATLDDAQSHASFSALIKNSTTDQGDDAEQPAELPLPSVSPGPVSKKASAKGANDD